MTLKEIAEQAGVTAATVSHVINNSAPVREETRQKVLKIIQESGYQSNMLARGLRGGKTKIIGVLVEDIAVWHTALIIDGINAVADEHGYNIILSNLRLNSKTGNQFSEIMSYRAEINKAANTLLGMQVDGIIYIGMHDREISHVLNHIAKPIVYCYCYTNDGEGSSVRYDNERCVYQMTMRLIEMGHRRIGVIRGRADSEPSRLRTNGFMQALQEKGIVLPEAWNEIGDWTYQSGMQAAMRMLAEVDDEGRSVLRSSEERPSVIVALNDEMAVGCYNAAAELGLSIPRDLSVTGFDNSELSQHMIPMLTTISRPLREMGSRAIELLRTEINHKGTEAYTSVVFPCQILERGSVRRFEHQENIEETS